MSETALFSLSSMKIKAYAKDADPRKQLIAKLLAHPKDLLVTVFILNTIVNILLQNVSSSMSGIESGWEWKVGFPLVMTLLFGEIIPKNLGFQNNVKFASMVSPVIDILQKLLKPVRQAIIAITAPISRGLFFYLKRNQEISKKELMHVLRASEKHGVLHKDEAELVAGYLNLQDAIVKELARPREDILFYDIHEPLSKLTYLFVEQEVSRIPVCDKNIDNIQGILSAKAYFLHNQRMLSGHDLIPILEKPFYVPETTLARRLIRQMNEINQVLALVVDEYGSISGLISSEDLAETVIGQIADLRDKKSLYTRAGTNEIIASGRLELADFNEMFNTNLVSENNMVTLGGWLTEQLGDIPKAGTKYETHDFLFHVLSAYPNRVRRLYIRKLKGKRKAA
ncbi:hypothetical protein PARA125_001693 [Parachlamydia sp. AcF125]|nr:hypothetical protein [Parachlamydia sp. AcF125]